MYQILIVDDHTHLVESLSITIPWQELGIEKVHKAFCAEEAFELLHEYPIDILLTDIRMPGMSGLEMLAQVRNIWKNIQCIIMSGYDDFDYAKEALLQKAVDYLLKPVEEEELINSVINAIATIRKEWEEIASYQQAVMALHNHLPQLRSEFLNELLRGRRMSNHSITEKIQTFEIPFQIDDRFVLILIRMESDFYEYDDANSLSLFEYAIGNIAEELFRDQYSSLHCKDSYEYLTFLVQCPQESDLERLELLSKHLQANVKKYLKGKISFLIGSRGLFPEDVHDSYQQCLSAFRKYISDDREICIRLTSTDRQVLVKQIRSLYELPHLEQLLEMGRWKEAEQKIDNVFTELADIEFESAQEYRLEAYFAIANSFSFIAHKSGYLVEELFEHHVNHIVGGYSFRSLLQFKEWAFHLLQSLKNKTEIEKLDIRALLVRQVQEYIESHLSQDVSLQAIADHVHLNPNYLSTIYKTQMGEGISDYLYNLRMEKSAYYLQNTGEKIYEISARLGFQNTNYFIKVFKKYYDSTPQEYRERSNQGRIANMTREI